MGLRTTAMLAAAGATLAGAGLGWHESPSGPGTALVRTFMPAGAPVYVTPKCTLTQLNTLLNTDGSAPDRTGPGPGRGGGPVPAGFAPVRVVRCGEYGDGMSRTETQSEIVDPAKVKAVLAAYRTTTVRERREPVKICTENLDNDPETALVDARGAAILPAAPRDSCHHVIPAVRTALADDLWIVTASVTIR